MRPFLLALPVALIMAQPASANMFDKLQQAVEETTKLGLQSQKTQSTLPAGLSQTQIIEGLREALKVGSERVVSQIGAVDGYNADPKIHIPLPAELQQVQSLLNKFGLGAMADDVELRLNRAAEKAAPKAKEIIWKAITNMKMEDAQTIYNGPKDAATQYFKKVSSDDLRQMITPVAEDSLKDVGALQAYDALLGQYKSMPFVPDLNADLVSHTTELAMIGIFHYLAQEEAAIRENPVKRTTNILKTVFGK